MNAMKICDSSALIEGGDGVRFSVDTAEGEAPAFVVRFDRQARAYLNRCAHVPVELDWTPGKFFDDSGLYFICATHGAMYDAGTGECVGGPCHGQGLIPVAVEEHDGAVFLTED